ncbi:MAG: CoA-binding protein [Hyphomicrobiaceae bacterium]|nr:CoA-binding protein [Hyphomicrobiaceae bacterium]
MSFGAYSDEEMVNILRTVKTFAVIGASAKPNRPSNGVMSYLISHGYEVHPVNPGHAGETIHGRAVYGRLAEVPAPVDVVDIFRNPKAALDVTRAALSLKDQLGIKVIWMQLGVRNEEAAAEAEAAGLKVIMDRCPKIEISRLGVSRQER